MIPKAVNSQYYLFHIACEIQLNNSHASYFFTTRLHVIQPDFVGASGGIDDFSGQIFIFMVLLIAAVESALGLVFLVIYFRIWDTIGVNSNSYSCGYFNWNCVSFFEIVVYDGRGVRD